MCYYMDISKCFKMGALVEKRGVWLVVLKICFEKLATMSLSVLFLRVCILWRKITAGVV